jgi:lipopolysaccharide/colanic/teichoic acid biosynthesis glycosyltransferase
MTTAAKAKTVRTKISSSAITEFPSRAKLPLNRDVDRDWKHKNHIPEFSAKLLRESWMIGEGEDNQVIPSPTTIGWKRVLDVFCILISLPFLLPLLGLIAVWIRLVSNGPALFRQERIGRDGRRFVLYKFRSMKMNSAVSCHEKHLRQLVESNSPMIKLDLLCDSRLIPFGCLLRASGLDELPQLLNVLRGEMSLVGPRPCLPSEYAFFSQSQRERFQALPGLTGNWQVNGKNRSTFSEMNVLDVDYVRNASLVLDLQIIMRTPRTLMHQISLAFRQRLSAKQRTDSPMAEPKTSRECVS